MNRRCSPKEHGAATAWRSFSGRFPPVRYAVERVSRPDWRIAPPVSTTSTSSLLPGGELCQAVEGKGHVLNESGQYILFLPGCSTAP